MRERTSVFVLLLILLPLSLLSIEAFRVTAVTAEVSEREFAGFCPHRFIFTGRITVNRAGTVRYRWTRSDGAGAPEQTRVFGAAGTQIVSDYWELGGGMDSFPDRWEAIEVLSPNTVTSNRALFSLRCIPRVMAPNYEISGAIDSGPQGNLVTGRQVKVIVAHSGADPLSQVVTLDAGGRATYHFSRPLGIGGYMLTVEKVPYSGSSGLNVCFQGTTPANRRVELSAATPRATDQNFTVLYVVGWDRTPCW